MFPSHPASLPVTTTVLTTSWPCPKGRRKSSDARPLRYGNLGNKASLCPIMSHRGLSWGSCGAGAPVHSPSLGPFQPPFTPLWFSQHHVFKAFSLLQGGFWLLCPLWKSRKAVVGEVDFWGHSGTPQAWSGAGAGTWDQVQEICKQWLVFFAGP